MARTVIPGTRTLWSIIRGYINDMTLEIYTKLFETGKVLSDNNYTDEEQTKLSGIETGAQVNTVVPDDLTTKLNTTLPTAIALTTGSNSILLTNIAGQDYGVYDMASGALTLTPAASPIRGGYAYCIIIADGATSPNFEALCTANIAAPTAPLKGTYDNTNDAVNYLIFYCATASDGNLKYYTEIKQAD
jgi:hypothetical protein